MVTLCIFSPPSNGRLFWKNARRLYDVMIYTFLQLHRLDWIEQNIYTQVNYYSEGPLTFTITGPLLHANLCKKRYVSIRVETSNYWSN